MARIKNNKKRKFRVIRSVNKHKNNNLYNLTFIVFAVAFALSYFYLDSSVTGFTILDSQIAFNETTSIDLGLNVTSLRLSGYLEGSGTAKIYLDSYLVLDSSLLNKSSSQTGENITDNQSSGNTFGIQETYEEEVSEPEVLIFVDVCLETCLDITPSSLLKAEIEGQLAVEITNFRYTLEEVQPAEEDNPENETPVLSENQTVPSNQAQPGENETFLELPVVNEPIFGIPVENFTSNETISEENLTIPAANTTEISPNLTLENITLTGDELIQVNAEINKPVEWKLRTKNKTIELPSEATNVEVYKEVFSLASNVTREKAKLKNGFGINSVPENKDDVSEHKVLIEVDEDNETQLEVTYFTKAPYSIEEPFYEKAPPKIFIKNITIKSDSEFHYQNVLSYTNLAPEIQNIEQVKIYHYEIKNISGGIGTNGSDYQSVKTDVTNNEEYNVYFEDTNNNSLIDRIYWNTLNLSEQNFTVEISLNILTVQSYPTVGGNWTVLFNTTGTANLTIKASNGTTWSNNLNNTATDLTFLELKCGNNIQNYQWIDSSVFIENYSCNETGTEISKVLTKGKHTLEFTFGDITKYAYNLADVLNITLYYPSKGARFPNQIFTSLNITQEGNISRLIIYAGNTSNLDFNNILYINKSITGVQANNITYNFSALPIKPDGTDGLVLLMHFDNVTNSTGVDLENNTNVFDWSLNNNNASCTLSGTVCPLWNSTGGKFGGAFEFNALDNVFNVSDSASLDLTSAVTISAWIKGKSSIFGDGTDGNLTIANTTDINKYAMAAGRTFADGIAYVVTAPNDGSDFVVRNQTNNTLSNGLEVGDEILLINMQGSGSDYEDVGNYEFLRIKSLNASTINFTSNITKSYDGTSAANQKVIVQRVPQYTIVNITSAGNLTASAWDGLTIGQTQIAGYRTGIIAFRANVTLDVQSGGEINLIGNGYRGGAGGNDGIQGESFNGSGIASNKNNAGGGSGGCTNDF